MSDETGYIITTSRERQGEPLDWSCSNGLCDEALPGEEGPMVGNPVCPQCGGTMIRARYCIAVPR